MLNIVTNKHILEILVIEVNRLRVHRLNNAHHWRSQHIHPQLLLVKNRTVFRNIHRAAEHSQYLAGRGRTNTARRPRRQLRIIRIQTVEQGITLPLNVAINTLLEQVRRGTLRRAEVAIHIPNLVQDMAGDGEGWRMEVVATPKATDIRLIREFLVTI